MVGCLFPSLPVPKVTLDKGYIISYFHRLPMTTRTWSMKIQTY